MNLTERLAAFYNAAEEASSSETWTRKRKFLDDTRSIMVMHRDKLRWVGSWYTARLLPAEEQFSNPQVMDIDSALLSGDVDLGFWQMIWAQDIQGGGDLQM